MKMRTIKFTSKLLTEALGGKATSFSSNLPSDTELLDVKVDLATNQIVAIVRSDSFPDIPETYPIPELTLIYKEKQQTTAPPASTVGAKVEAKPAAVAKPERTPAKKPQAAPSRIENEFSPDQRKLLSFKVEDDHVVVKPIQFLKEEWEDINEVVRSCGGRWVKGDIISYWEIPLQ